MDTLFKLIKTLQKSEKRFFRLYAGRHVKGNNHNILLFDAIEKQKVYDEKALKKKFHGSTISKHFAFNKQYLYKQVLKALHQFHSPSSAEEIIKEQTHHIKILFDRRLLDACEKLIDKTLALAKKYETYPEQIRLLEWKMEMTAVRLFRGISEKDILEIEAEMKSTLTRLADYMYIYLEQRKLYFHAETRGILMVRDHKEKYLKLGEKIKSKKVEGFRANLFREYFFELVNLNLSGNPQGTETNIRNILALVEKYPHIIKDNPREYQTTVYNYGIHKLYARDYESAQQLADQLKKFTDFARLPPGPMQASLDFHAILQIGIYQGLYRYEEAEKYFEEFQKKQKKLEGLATNYSRQKVIYYVMSRLSFVTGHYKSSISHLSNLTSAKVSNERTDIDDYARIMQLLAFFVTEKTLSLETLSRTVRKSIAKNNNLFRIEKLVLDFVSRNNKHIHNKSLMYEQYSALLQELNKINTAGTKEEKLALEYIDLIKWAEMQIKK